MAVSQNLVHSDAPLKAVQRLVPLAEEAGMSMATLALAWVLRRGEIASAITGASRPEQVRSNAAASAVELSEDLPAAVDRALGDVSVSGPTLAPPRSRASNIADPTRIRARTKTEAPAGHASGRGLGRVPRVSSSWPRCGSRPGRWRLRCS
ncbi:aldo/keto reductase [Streptomyces massasporeus]|uniref:aldo/keto reductase n=1 Tax=Streptomyces massasporeus TaxID=67324 RepID=UPI0033CB9BA5